jgi:YHS domain-containing protein
MKKKKVSTRKMKKQTQTWNPSEKKVLISIGVALLIIILIWYTNEATEKYTSENAYKVYIDKPVPDSVVCMVSGIVKDKAIKPIEINGKTYWGCCGNCLTQLKNNIKNVLFAKDPVSGAMISKSGALKRLNPENKKYVLYFETDKNYELYVKTLSVKKKV